MKISLCKGYKIPLLAISLLIHEASVAQQAKNTLENPAELAAVLDTVIAKRMERYHIPGFSVAVVKDNRLFWSKGYGYSNLDNKMPVEADKTIFRIGSITKVFTALGMMQLVDEGRIKLDDDVNQYLVDKISYKNNSPITLHHLLTHSEGFREIPGRRTTSADKILPMHVFLKDRLIQDHYAGEIGQYGTYGIALSGLLLETISGMPYRDYIQKKIFDPLEMDYTNATDVAGEHKKYMAVGYEYNKGNFKPMDFEYYHTFPASDINSTVNNMSNFMMMILNNGTFKGRVVLQSQSARTMQTTQFRNDPKLVGYTYGLFESTINGTKSLFHGGVMDGYASLMYLFPESNIGLFMTCNTENHPFLNSLLNNFLYYFFPPPTAHADHPEPSLKTDLERFVGSYQRPGAPTIDIKLNADSTLSFWGGKWVQIQPLLFRVVNGTLDTGEDLIAFKENARGEIVWITTGPFVYSTMRKLSSPTADIRFSQKELRSWEGTYILPNQISFTILQTNGNLWVSLNIETPSELEAQSRNSFFSKKYNATIRFLDNGEAEINMNGTTLKCIKKR